MTELGSAYFREQAARCRRLAAATYDQQTYDSLNRSAEEFEDEAMKRDGESASDNSYTAAPGD